MKIYTSLKENNPSVIELVQVKGLGKASLMKFQIYNFFSVLYINKEFEWNVPESKMTDEILKRISGIHPGSTKLANLLEDGYRCKKSTISMYGQIYWSALEKSGNFWSLLLLYLDIWFTLSDFYADI